MLLRMNSILRVDDMKPPPPPPSPESNTQKPNSVEYVLAKKSHNGHLHLVDVVDFILRARKLSTQASPPPSSSLSNKNLDKEPPIPKIVIPTDPPSPDHEDIVVSKQRETAAIYRKAPQRSLSLTHASYPCRPTAQRRSTISAKSHQPPSPRSSRPTLHGYGGSTDSLGAPISIRLLGPEPYIDLNSTKHTPPKNRRPSAYSSSSASSSSSSSCSSYSIERKKSIINDSSSRHQHKRVAFKTTSQSAAAPCNNNKALPPSPAPSNMISNTR
ncbi:hypothetical protein O0I10_005089 [Lichtheimia ornata]|uniref:Uncharacterized protein n=1 Tax=Lichtheimia ornata TaxID=688661 RepID=A0AAD7V7K9_9FUNG|nr:uncharacterized protein O0I10_005089 [Lichtheimia ornata]KAJ8659051.1 hypothetical protein O0I10_005089 [Lichtheimia ornata]